MSRHIAPPHFEDQAYRELVRSRRYTRPMTLLMLLTDPSHSANLRARVRSRRSLVAQVEDRVRRYDVVSGFRGHVAVLCPELEPAEGGRLAARLGEQLGVAAGAASFPDDGADLHALLTVAESRAHGGSAAAARDSAVDDGDDAVDDADAAVQED